MGRYGKRRAWTAYADSVSSRTDEVRDDERQVVYKKVRVDLLVEAGGHAEAVERVREVVEGLIGSGEVGAALIEGKRVTSRAEGTEV